LNKLFFLAGCGFVVFAPKNIVFDVLFSFFIGFSVILVSGLIVYFLIKFNL